MIDDVAASGAELGVVVAFGQLLPVALLEALPLGFVNLHFSLLPRWRGAAPVERAILAGDRETGVCLMQVEAGLDTGPVFACARTPIDAVRHGGLVARPARRSWAPRCSSSTSRASPRREPEPQVGEATYAEKLGVDEFRLDPARPAAELVARRAGRQPAAGRVGARRRPAGQGVRRDRVGRTRRPRGRDRRRGLTTVDGTLHLREMQPEGKRRMAWDAWRRGHPDDLVIDA